MTTTDLYPSADTVVWHEADDSSLATLIAAAGNNLRGTYTGTFACGLETSASSDTNTFLALRRGLFSFDTSGIPDTATITSAKLTLYRSGGNNLLGNFSACLTGASPASATAHDSTDYATVTATELASRVAYGDWAWQTTHDFDLNASGIAYINKTGYTTFAVRLSWDVDGSFTGTWGAEKWSEIQVNFNEATSYKPVLSITYVETNYVEIAGDLAATATVSGTLSIPVDLDLGSGDCDATTTLVGTLVPFIPKAVIERKVGTGEYTVIATIDWVAGPFVDPDPLEVGTTYTYRVRKTQQFDIPGQYSDEKSLQFDDMGIRLLTGEMASTSTVVGVLATASTSEQVRIERKTGDGEFIYYDLVNWTDTPYYDTGPFEHQETYTYRIKKIVAGYTGNPSNEVIVTYNVFGIVTLDGTLAATSQVDGTLDVPALAIIERKIGEGSFTVLDYVPYDPALYTDYGPFSEQTYTYRIKKRVSGAEGECSNEVEVVWVTPNYVTLEGAVSGESDLASGLSEYHYLSGSTGAESGLAGRLSQVYDFAGTVSVTSGVVGALTRITPVRGLFAAVSTVSGVFTRLRHVAGTVTATSAVGGAATMFVRLDGGVTGTGGLLAAATKKVAVAGEIAGAGAVSPALLHRIRLVSGALVAESGLAAPHLGVSAARIVTSTVSPIDGQDDQSYLQAQYSRSHLVPIGGDLWQSHLQTQYRVSHVAAIAASVEGYIYAKNLLELMIGEGPFIIKVDEMPLDTEYTESDYEEEKTT